MLFHASLVTSLFQKNEVAQRCRATLAKQLRSCIQGQFRLNGISISTASKNKWATCKQLSSNIAEASK